MIEPMTDDLFSKWYDALERRHMSRLTFQEIRHAVQALSSRYVERRASLQQGSALNSAGKRAAFAMFYAPLHFLLVSRIVGELGAGRNMPDTLLDLGCGTGSASAAWAIECHPAPAIVAVDRNSWALEECRW